MSYNDWNPELYLKFDKERTQPTIDLVSRINFEKPKRIIDIGCGPGNSTQILVNRWQNSIITGIDNSPAMIKKARNDFPQQKWNILDVTKDEIDGEYDIVFSNAAIQWMPDHPALFKKFHKILSGKGLLAVQIPLFFDMPLGKSITRISKDNRWSSKTEEVTKLFIIHNSSTYYDYLSELFTSVEMWETDYMHIMDSHLSILEMIRSTGLRPYLNKLESDELKKEFEDKVFYDIKKYYPLQKNGKILFPFKRLFFIAGK